MKLFRSLFIAATALIISFSITLTAMADDIPNETGTQECLTDDEAVQAAEAGQDGISCIEQSATDVSETGSAINGAPQGIIACEEDEESVYTEEYLAKMNAQGSPRDTSTVVEPGSAGSISGSMVGVPDCVVSLRQQVVDYALSFVGGKYRWGGTDPHSGADCSGFTAYIMKMIAGIVLPHSSRQQSQIGTKVAYENLRPGDLVFYAEAGSGVDHVAMYIGCDQVVHASSAKTGIKISGLNHRNVVGYMDILG